MIYSILISFFEWKFSDISIAEICSILFISYTLIYKNYSISKSFLIPFYILCTFVVWVITSYFFLDSNIYFNTSSFRNNLIRLIFYTLGFYSITNFFKNDVYFYKVIKGLEIILVIVCILGIIEFFLSVVNIDITFFIHGKRSSRASSIFSEPAHFSIFISISIFLVIRYYNLYNKLDNIKHLVYLVFFTLLFSFSMVGYSFFVLLLIHYLILSGRVKKGKLIESYLPLILLLFVVFIGLLQTGAFQDLIVKRFDNISSGTDGSTSHRLYGAFEILKVLKGETLIVGNGLSKLNPFFATYTYHFKNFYIAPEDAPNIGLNNIISQITIDTGIVGILLFILFVFSFTRKHLVFFIVFIVFCFSWGFFNTPFFWFYIYISYVIIDKQNVLVNESRNYNIRFLRKHSSIV